MFGLHHRRDERNDDQAANDGDAAGGKQARSKQKQPRTPFDPQAGVGAYCAAACQDAGVILRNLGDSVAFCPPLIITEDQIDELVNKFSIGLDATLDWATKTHLI